MIAEDCKSYQPILLITSKKKYRKFDFATIQMVQSRCNSRRAAVEFIKAIPSLLSEHRCDSSFFSNFT